MFLCNLHSLEASNYMVGSVDNERSQNDYIPEVARSLHQSLQLKLYFHQE